MKYFFTIQLTHIYWVSRLKDIEKVIKIQFLTKIICNPGNQKDYLFYCSDKSRCTNVMRERKYDLLCAFIVQRKVRLILCRDQRSRKASWRKWHFRYVWESETLQNRGGGRLSKFLGWAMVNGLAWLECRGTRVEVRWETNLGQDYRVLSNILAWFGILFCRKKRSI